jgi:hypothetical protein
VRNGRWDFISAFIAYASLSLECTVESRNYTELEDPSTKAEGGPSVKRLRQGFVSMSHLFCSCSLKLAK